MSITEHMHRAYAPSMSGEHMGRACARTNERNVLTESSAHLAEISSPLVTRRRAYSDFPGFRESGFRGYARQILARKASA